VVLSLVMVCCFVILPTIAKTNDSSVYYFFSDVFPPMYNDYRPLDPPQWWSSLFETRNADQGTTHEEIQLRPGEGIPAPEVR